MADKVVTITFHKDMTRAELDRAKLVLETLTQHYEASANADKLLRNQTEAPLAKCVGRDGNVEPEIAAKLFGAEPSVGNEPMKETLIGSDSEYDFYRAPNGDIHVKTPDLKSPFDDYKPEE